MKCQIVRIPGLGAGFVCGSRPRRHPCSHPGCTNTGTRQCDYPLGENGRTCDRYVCDGHATPIGPNLDHCPRHAAAGVAPVQSDLFGWR